MPYIDKARRRVIDQGAPCVTAGELNYVITRVLDDYLEVVGLRYSTLNEVVGVLECAKLELYRRIAAPYEDWKLAENGDVYRRQA